MAKFVELNEAAKMLGVTPDELVEMRSEGDIHGYRDGGSWKFKIDEVERVLAERGGPDQSEEADDSVLVSEEELGRSGEGSPGTVIGKGGGSEGDDQGTDDAGGSDLAIGSGAAIHDDAGSGIDSDVTLVPGAGGDSDVSLVPDPGSDKELGAASSGALGSDLELEGGSGTGNLDLSTSTDTGTGSSDLDVGLESDLALSDDDDIVLSAGSGSGSDLSLGSADSGINLGSPSDSGLSLEADSGISLQTPTDSGLSLEDDGLDSGSSSISSLELPEAEDAAVADEEAVGSVQQDDQFMLAPSDEMFADESDSGSQVIALEDSEAFEPEGDQGLLGEASGLEDQLDALGGAGMAPALAAPTAYGRELPEAPYTIWNVLGLGLIVCFLTLAGVLMTDIMRNMWAWDQGRDMSTSISEGITRAFGL